MPVTKIVEYISDSLFRVLFINELGQFHRDRGRPAMIVYDAISHMVCYIYYVNGVRFRPRKKGKDQPNYVEVGAHRRTYAFITEDTMTNPDVADRPLYISIYTDGYYEMRYLNFTIVGHKMFKEVRNNDGHFIIRYVLDHPRYGSHTLDNLGNITPIPSEYARNAIPSAPSLTNITETPLTYFEPL